MAKGEVNIQIKGDASDFKRAIDAADDHTSKLGAGVKKLGMAAAAMGAALVAGAVAFGKSAMDAAGEAMKVNAQTEAVIKSTGGAAGVTAKHVADMAHSLQGLSGVQDETIQTGANMLLTFTNVRNEAGKGRDIFDQATKTMLDMSVAMGSDAQTAAMQLGKALNNPTEGLGALRRVGIQFTDSQKDQIKVLQASGDMVGAQSVMLAELQRQFGGSAAAAGEAMTPFERLKLKFGDFQEEVGMRLIPVIEKVSDWLGRVVPPIVAALVPVFQGVVAFVRDSVVPFFRDTFLPAMRAVFEAVAAKVGEFKQWWDGIWPQIREVITHFVNVAQALWDRFGERIMRVVANSVEAVKGILQGLFTAIKGVVELVVALINGDWSRAWDAAKSIIEGLGGAIRAALTGIVKNIGEYAAIIGSAMASVGSAMARALLGALSNLGYDLYLWFYSLPGKIGEWLSGLPGALVGIFKAAFNGLASLWNSTIGAFRFEVPSWIPGVGGRGWDVPDMPHFDNGGVMPGPLGMPGLAVLHGGETVLPTHKAGGAGGARPAVTVQVSVGTLVGQGGMEEFADVIRRRIFDNGLTNGSAFAGRG